MARYRFWTGKIEDERGVTHRPRPMWVLTGVSGPAPDSRAEQLAIDLTVQRRWALRTMGVGSPRVLGTLWCFIAVAIAAVCLVGQWMGLGFPDLWLIIIAALFAGVSTTIIFVVQERLSHRLDDAPWLTCLVCGYVLIHLEPEPDGCTVCPECGAAWHYKPPDPADEPEA
ncbi:MAG: hypothetical protein R3B49_09985 [Phycisphaerales bacterium]